MTILITSGSGANGTHLANLLHAYNYPILVTYRSRPISDAKFPSVRLDWNKPSTFTNPFDADKNIDRVFLTVPFVLYPLEAVKPFIHLAIEKGVKRFVLLSATTYAKGEVATGHVHKYLSDLDVEFHAVRPTWYFENFLTSYLNTIRKNDEIPTATGGGKVAFVSIRDVAEVSKQALISDEPLPNEETIIVGPELLNYDEIAAMLTSILNRPIKHRRLSDDEALKLWQSEFVAEDYSKMLVDLEILIREGKEAANANPEVTNKVVGQRRLRDFLEEHKEKFAPVRG